MEYFPFIGIGKNTKEEELDNKGHYSHTKDNGSRAKTTSDSDDGYYSYYSYYYDEDKDSLLELSSNCNHKYFSGIAESSKLICDTCHQIIGEQRFENVCSRKTFRNPAQYSIYKIYPYLRSLTLDEIYNLK
jgi:hypothetical protein